MEDFRWKEFEMRVEAYRYYLNIALQTNVFFYAITGVILGFYLNRTTNEYLVYALLLPIMMAGILGGVFKYAADLQRKAANTIEDIRRELRREKSLEKRITIKAIPDLELLYILLKIFGLVFFLIGLALVMTPFLKAAPFPWCEWPPTYLMFFTAIGLLVLVVARCGTYSYAHKHDKGAKEERRKNRRDDQPQPNNGMHPTADTKAPK